jgi:hypothetical protein
MSPRAGKASTIAAKLRERVADELPVEVDHLEDEPPAGAVGEEAIERACCAVQADGQAELIA